MPNTKRGNVDRAPGLSVRLKFTLSYAGFLMLAGFLLIAVVWVFLLRYVPEQAITVPGELVSDSAGRPDPGLFVPGRNDLWRAFGPKAAIMLGFLLLLGVLGGWILAGRMLAPLQRITAATRAADSGSLSHRTRLAGRKDEFRELADAFDGMLARLEAHVAEQQRFSANASHELRTPLAITQTLLDVAGRDPNCDTGELVDRLRVVNTRAIELTEALLLLSRAGQRGFASDHVDLSLAAEEATETLLPLAEERGIAIETFGDTALTAGSQPLLLQVMTNLVHNAIVHNLPERGSVWVGTSVHQAVAALTVENTGDKLSPQLVSTLTEPFRRGAERVHGAHAGLGLGLAIVDRIVQAHDGTLTLPPRPDGGLRVTVQLPAEHRLPPTPVQYQPSGTVTRTVVPPRSPVHRSLRRHWAVISAQLRPLSARSSPPAKTVGQDSCPAQLPSDDAACAPSVVPGMGPDGGAAPVIADVAAREFWA